MIRVPLHLPLASPGLPILFAILLRDALQMGQSVENYHSQRSFCCLRYSLTRRKNVQHSFCVSSAFLFPAGSLSSKCRFCLVGSDNARFPDFSVKRLPDLANLAISEKVENCCSHNDAAESGKKPL